MPTTQYGNSTLAYSVKESPRRKTLGIHVSKEAGVEVVAPKHTDPAFIERAVQAKGRWILHQLRDLEGMAPPPPRRSLIEGESYLYMGRNYRLRYLDAKGDIMVKMRDGFLDVECLPDVRGTRQVREAIEAWYRGHAKRVFRERIQIYVDRLGIAAPQVHIRKQAKRWASCTPKGDILVNWQLIAAPASLIDYVLAHEVVHLKHSNHDTIFYTKLQKLMPDHANRAHQLEKGGATFVVA